MLNFPRLSDLLVSGLSPRFDIALSLERNLAAALGVPVGDPATSDKADAELCRMLRQRGAIDPAPDRLYDHVSLLDVMLHELPPALYASLTPRAAMAGDWFV